MEMREDPHDRGHGSVDGDLAGAHERYQAETHPARGLRGERRAQIVGHREQDADEILVRDGIALQERREQPPGRVEQGRGLVPGDEDGSTGGTNLHRASFPRSERPRATIRATTGATTSATRLHAGNARQRVDLLRRELTNGTRLERAE